MTKQSNSRTEADKRQRQHKARVLQQIASRVVSILPLEESDSKMVLKIAGHLNSQLYAMQDKS